MKSKEDILHHEIPIDSKGDPAYTKKECLEAMDLYGKEASIAFMAWVIECEFDHENGRFYISKNPHGIKGGKYYTTEELYNLFLQHQSQQP